MPLTEVKSKQFFLAAANSFDQFENERNSRPHAKLRIAQIPFEMTEFQSNSKCR